MKSPFKREMLPQILGVIIVVVVGITFAMFLYRFDAVLSFTGRLLSILSPLFIGVIIAFLAGSITNWLERALIKLFCRKRNRKKLCRVIAMVFAYLLLTSLAAALFALGLPRLIDSIRNLVASAPGYVRDLSAEIDRWMAENRITDEYFQGIFGSWESILLRAVEYIGQQVPILISLSANITNGIVSFLLGVIISVYMLASRERFSAQARKILVAYLPGERVDLVTHWAHRTKVIFGHFVANIFFHSLAVGALCYFYMSALGMEYAVVTSVLVGAANILPVFGQFAGGIAGVVVLLFISPLNALWFGLFMLAIHLFDAHFLSPRLMGDSVGVPMFWLLTAVVVGGGFWGLLGMIVIVPVFTLLYEILRTAVEARLRRRGLPADTGEYMDDERQG